MCAGLSDESRESGVLICFWSESETQSDLKTERRSKRPWLWKTLNVKKSVCSQMLFEVTSLFSFSDTCTTPGE